MAGLPRGPLSLQEICMLNVLFRVDQFPVLYLTLLPRAIRQRLLNRLPRADILHLGDTALFSDLHNFQDTLMAAKERLVEIVFKSPISLLDIVSIPGDPVSLIRKTKSFTSLEASLFGIGVVPKHLQRFVRDPVRIPPDLVWLLLGYCNMQCGLSKLRINCYDFPYSFFWENYWTSSDPLSFQYWSQDSVLHNSHPNQIIIPFFQEFLSSVEELELCARAPAAVGAVPYIILYNVVTSKQPRLKHLKLCSELNFTGEILEPIIELFCTLHQFIIMADLSITLPLSSSKLKPYQLESITIFTTSQTCGLHILQPILAYQMLTLRSVAIQGLGFCFNKDKHSSLFNKESKYTIYSPALLSSLNQLLKQLQFQSLTIDKISFQAACDLIKTFLITPTSHEQSLSIETKKEEKKNSVDVQDLEGSKVNESRKRNDVFESAASNMIKQSLPNLSSQSLSKTNAQYKCLDLGLSCSGLHSWLFTLPELKLKKLGICTQDISIVPEDMIQVEHVAFTTPAETTTDVPTISSALLEKFVISNPALKWLEFTAPCFIPSLNYCLSVLYQQRRGLEEIILNLVKPCSINFEHMKDFFIRVRDLSHSNGTTLVITVKLLDSWVDESRMFVDLSKFFQEKKIRKIVFTLDAITYRRYYQEFIFKQLLKCFELLTDELVLRHETSYMTGHWQSDTFHSED